MRASERNEAVRAVWRREMQGWAAQDLVFLDESGCNTSLHRLYGRAPKGQRLEGVVPRNYKHNTTIIGALSLERWDALTLEGACDRLAFETFIEKVLVPTLRPGQIVIMDNLNIHKSAKARQWVEDAGCRWEHLPTYSPDLLPRSQPDRADVEQAQSSSAGGCRAHPRTLGCGHYHRLVHRHAPRCTRLVSPRRLLPHPSTLLRTALKRFSARLRFTIWCPRGAPPLWGGTRGTPCPGRDFKRWSFPQLL